ncbi:IS3 family transposase [Spiroplasma endosymbiont of Aleiodes alternator]|uniref:IS3 family transposase n=1 Tax=Spiroplasma endosymbiont of Aleiodes alternator TaxID=3139329 RepID=UPI003CCAFA59
MYSWFTIINSFCYFTNWKFITFIFFYCYYWFNSQILIHCANSFLFLIIELTQFNFYINVLFNFTIQALIQLKLELFDYINWYNNIRIHSTLKYLTPVKYEEQMSTKK